MGTVVYRRMKTILSFYRRYCRVALLPFVTDNMDSFQYSHVTTLHTGGRCVTEDNSIHQSGLAGV